MGQLNIATCWSMSRNAKVLSMVCTLNPGDGIFVGCRKSNIGFDKHHIFTNFSGDGSSHCQIFRSNTSSVVLYN